MSKKNLNINYFSETIDKPQFNISEMQPIKCGRNKYSMKQSCIFDMHYPIEIGIVISGEMIRYYQHSKMRLRKGQIWFCGIWEPHGYEVCRSPCEAIFIVIMPQFLAQMQFSELGPFNWLAPFMVSPEQRPQVTFANSKQVYSLFQQISDTCCEMLVPSKMIVAKLLMLLLLETIQSNWKDGNGDIFVQQTAFNPLSASLRMLFNSEMPVTTQQAAQVCCLSIKTFEKIFKEAMGISFSQFGLRYRLNAAARDIVTTLEPLKAIAFKRGFSDSSHLCRLFLQHYHCTPTQYKKICKNETCLRESYDMRMNHLL